MRNDDYQNSQMCIVTGPNIDIAIKLIKRMKALFEPKLGITFDSNGIGATYTAQYIGTLLTRVKESEKGRKEEKAHA
ncbi:MAG: hypothetical protein ACJ71J_10765 [Nitrososphaeraceae archaeon]